MGLPQMPGLMGWLDILFFWSAFAAVWVFALAVPGMIFDVRDIWIWWRSKRRKNSRDA
jgi:hypothetical protein